MLFFFLLFVLTGAAAVVSRVGVSGVTDWRARMRFAMATAFLFTGVDHLITPGRYVPMLPTFFPFPDKIVLFTGLCEISGAIGLLTRRRRRLAAIMLAVYLICETPANVNMAVEGLSVEGMPTARWFYWVRLFLLPVAIWWALYCGGVITSKRTMASRANRCKPSFH